MPFPNPMSLFIGIDSGTQSVKAVVLDLDALEAYLVAGPRIPAGGRVINLNPTPEP